VTRLDIEVNGKAAQAEIESTALLVDVLRQHLGLTGTHVGCDTAQCGACTVLLDGRPVKSCSILALQAQGRAVTTVEGWHRQTPCIHCRRPSVPAMVCNAGFAPPAC